LICSAWRGEKRRSVENVSLGARFERRSRKGLEEGQTTKVGGTETGDAYWEKRAYAMQKIDEVH